MGNRKDGATRAAAAALAVTGAIATSAAAGSLDGALEDIRKQQQLPGLAALVLREGKPGAEGAAGVRRLGEPGALSVDHRHAIGSLTKRLTGLLIARLVDDGKLKFDSTVGELLPEVPMREEYRKVTLRQLLDFTGGIPAYERIGPKITPQLFDLEGSLAERQAKFVRFLLQEPPAGPAGREARYSNASYALLGYIAATTMKTPYEALVEEWVFRPLGLASAGWGRPWHPSRPQEPWLHVAGPDGYAPEPDRERPPEQIFMAAGGAHMTLRDLARFARYEMRARRGDDALLRPETSRQWHRPAAGGAEPSILAGGTPALSACYALWPSRDALMVMATNAGSPGDAACKAVVRSVEGEITR